LQSFFQESERAQKADEAVGLAVLGTVRIKSVVHKEYLGASKAKLDESRRHVATLIGGGEPNDLRKMCWKIERVPGILNCFTMRNYWCNEFMYANGPMLKVGVSGQRRHVLTRDIGTMNSKISKTKWKINSVSGSSTLFTLKNLEHNEYLYTGGFKLDNKRRHALTWVGGTIPPTIPSGGEIWEIELVTPQEEQQMKAQLSCPTCALSVSPGKGSVNRGLREAKEKSIDTIFFEPGIHKVEGQYAVIDRAMKIMGAGRDKTSIHGGLSIKGTKEDGKRVELSGMTLTGSSGNGLAAHSGLSFLCDSMTITKSHQSGVAATNTIGRLINCGITQCGFSGIFISGNALIEIEGSQSKVEGNATWQHKISHGFRINDHLSSIHLLSPLTKESVSKNNYNDQNYYAWGNGTIKTVNSFIPQHKGEQEERKTSSETNTVSNTV
jgi:hypothetical protein